MRTKKQAIAIVILAALLSACVNTTEKTAITSYITNLFTKYPEATLIDVYKASFQDYFGPAHLLSDRNDVKKYIEYELANADTLCGAYYEPCGWRGQYVRVNLSVITDSLLDIEDFVSFFMASAQGEPTLTQDWLDEWATIQAVVKRLYPQLENFAADSVHIAHQLSEGNYVMHHSQSFNQHYHPHYRIIRSTLFERYILPVLDN